MKNIKLTLPLTLSLVLFGTIYAAIYNQIGSIGEPEVFTIGDGFIIGGAILFIYFLGFWTRYSNKKI